MAVPPSRPLPPRPTRRDLGRSGAKAVPASGPSRCRSEVRQLARGQLGGGAVLAELLDPDAQAVDALADALGGDVLGDRAADDDVERLRPGRPAVGAGVGLVRAA